MFSGWALSAEPRIRLCAGAAPALQLVRGGERVRGGTERQ